LNLGQWRFFAPGSRLKKFCVAFLKTSGCFA